MKTTERFENGPIYGQYESICSDGQTMFNMDVRSKNKDIESIDCLIGWLYCPHCGKPMHINDITLMNNKKCASYLCPNVYGCSKRTNMTLLIGAKLE